MRPERQRPWVRLTSDAAAVAPVGRGYTQRVELGCDAHAAPAVYGEMVIDAPDNVGGG